MNLRETRFKVRVAWVDMWWNNEVLEKIYAECFVKPYLYVNSILYNDYLIYTDI